MTTKPQPHRHPEAPPYLTIPGEGAAPDNDEPLPDAMFQEPHFTETMQVVRAYFQERVAALVSGDSAIYYLGPDGRQQRVLPDCYVAFGVDEVAIRTRNGYFIREVGKPPDFALEIASESTYENDVGPKRELYARLGIGEYWRFDATGGDYYGVALAGDRLEDGEYRPIEISRDAEGVVRGHSRTLGLDLCWRDGKLRFYDPVSGEYRRNLLEAEAARAEAETARDAAEEAWAEAETARDAAEEARMEAETARDAAERTMLAERTARQSAESENLRLREQLRRLQEQQPSSDGDEDSLPEV